ncbi:DNA replication complex GINS protein PSF2 isoform 1-T1 [Liasis olivaceus]
MKRLQENHQARRTPRTPQFNPELHLFSFSGAIPAHYLPLPLFLPSLSHEWRNQNGLKNEEPREISLVLILFWAKEKLEQIRDQERKEDTFTPMPNPFYMELTKLLLNYAADNIPKADEIRTLVKDMWDTRIAKLRVSADSFVRQQEAHATLDNLTLMEINTTGAFLTQALDHMYKLRTNLQLGESVQSQDF